VQVIQHAQRATPNKRIQSKEKAKSMSMDIKPFETVKHERYTH